MKRITKQMLAAVALTFAFASCNDKNDVNLPPIGGFNNANEVGAANLVAYWSFDGNNTESKQNLAGTSTGAGFSTGVKGQAYQGSSSASSYVVYSNPGTALPALQSFSMSFWLNTAQPIADLGTVTPGKGAQGIFDIVNSTGFWGNLHVNLEPFRSLGSSTTPNADTLLMKVEITNTTTGVVWVNQFPTVFLTNAVNKWIHVAITYDAASSRLSFYQNGVLTGTNSVGAAYGPFSGSAILYANDPGSATNVNGAPLYGNLKFQNATAVVIGTWQLSTTPPLTTGGGAQAWATNYGGALDELRIWNKALVAAEVNSLYLLEKAGR
jgi:hypothetical protein